MRLWSPCLRGPVALATLTSLPVCTHRMTTTRLFQLAVVFVAGGLAFARPGADLVERYYADSFYPSLQAALTNVGNAAPLSLSDVLVLIAGSLLILLWTRSVGAAWRRRSGRPLASGAFATLSGMAGAYVWFSLAWGLNYARPPLTDVLPFDPTRVTPEGVRALAERAIHEANMRYGAAHARGFPSISAMPADLVRSLHGVERRLGRVRTSVPGRPKRTLLAAYFRASGTDGMTSPFLLETLINPDLTGPERPMVLAHEWAHLSGYAPEDEASFVAVVSSLTADVSSQYSGWLSVALDAASQLPADERRRILAQLEDGPRRDRELIALRLRARVALVEHVGGVVYDRYLRSQGVEEGLFSYSRVVELLVGVDPSHPLSWRNL